MDFFGIDNSDNFMSGFIFAGWHLFFQWLSVFGGGCWCCFSTESLILAQDERWRRA
jgi:hypothetical protein